MANDGDKPTSMVAHKDDIVKAHILLVVCKINWKGNPDVKSLDDIKASLGEGGKTAGFANVPGLRHLYFAYNPENESMQNVYTFFSREALDAYLKSDLFAMAKAMPQFASVEYQIHDILEGTECSIDMGKWKGPGGAPSAADFTNAAHMIQVQMSVDYAGNPDVPNDFAIRYGCKADGQVALTKMYIDYPGLRSKFFTLCVDDNGMGRPTTDRVCGFYTWFSKKELEAYMETELWKMWPKQGQFAKGPITTSICEVMPGTERTMDLGSWSGPQPVRPANPLKATNTDIIRAHLLYVKATLNKELKEMYGQPMNNDRDLMGFLKDPAGMSDFYRVKGVRQLAFTYCEEDSTMRNVYIFYSREDLDTYLKSSLWQVVIGMPQFSKTEYEIHDVLEGTECSIDMGKWTKGQFEPTAADFNNAAHMIHVQMPVDYSGNPDVPDESAIRYGCKADGQVALTKMYTDYPGLRSKYFTLLVDDNGSGRPPVDRVCGFYMWFSKKELEAYMETDLWKMWPKQGQFAKGPIDTKITEVMNGTENCMDLGSWEGA